MMQFANRVVVPKHVLVRHLDGESVLLNLETEKYFGLDTTGTRMWELVTTSPSVDAAYARLLEEFEVEPELLRTHHRTVEPPTGTWPARHCERQCGNHSSGIKRWIP